MQSSLLSRNIWQCWLFPIPNTFPFFVSLDTTLTLFSSFSIVSIVFSFPPPHLFKWKCCRSQLMSLSSPTPPPVPSHVFSFLYLHVPPWWSYVISWLYISIGAGDSQIHVSNLDYSLDMQTPTSNWQINIFSLTSNRNLTFNIAKENSWTFSLF